jgi:hypothetical protein
MANTTTPNVIISKLFSLNTRDWIRGALMAIITAVVNGLYQFFKQGGTFKEVNWEEMVQLAISGLISYIILKLGTGPQIIVNNAPSDAIARVKSGAIIKVGDKPVASKNVV